MQETIFKKGRISVDKIEKKNTCYVIFINQGPTYGTSEIICETMEDLKYQLNLINICLFGKTMTPEKLEALINKIDC